MPVVIHEMRPVRATAVHKTDRLAELVCSNSFRGDKLDNAVGLLKEEMRRLDSLVMRTADANRVPAGAALAVLAWMAGFIVLDWANEFPEIRRRLEGFVRDGRLTYREDVQHGFENAPDTLQRLFSGRNRGKQLLKL